MIKLRGQTLTPEEQFTPESFSLNILERQSTATISGCVAGQGSMPDLKVGDWLLDDTEPGKGIVWRVKIADGNYSGRTDAYTLEHVINTLRDVSMFGEVKPETITGIEGAETCTVREAAEYVLGRQSVWRLGDFEYSDSAPFSFNGDDLFSAMEKITSTLDDPWWEYDLTSLPFTLHIRHKSAAQACEMRMGRNITSLRKTVDRSQMYTRIYPIGKKNLHITGDYISRNESIWGRKDKVETDQSQETEEMLRLWALDRLKRHCEPTVTITIGGLDLSRATGEPLDRLVIGTVCRVPLPEFGTTITERITKLSWKNKRKEPENVTVTLCNTRQDIASIISEQISGGGGGARADAKEKEEDHAWFVDTTSHVAMVAEAIIGRDGDTVDWSRVAEIIVDGSGIHQMVVAAQGSLVTAFGRLDMNDESLTSIFQKTGVDGLSDGETLYSRLIQTADRITAEVNRATAAEESLSSRITQTAESITAEITRATAAEGSLSSRITQTAESITAEVTRATDAEGSLSSRITQTAESITAEVTRASEAEGSLSSRITQTAESITAEITRATDAEGSLSSRITQTAESITAEVTRATDAEGSLSSRITQTAESITAEITRATEAEGSLSSRITQTAESITAEVTRATEAEGSLSSRITQTAESITAEVTRATTAEGSLSTRITQTAESITAEVTRATNAEGSLSSRLTQTAESITAEVTRATTAEGSLSSRITQEADKIALVVGTSGNTNYIKTASIVAGINAQSGSYVAISADKVDLTGYVTASDITAAFLKAIIAEIDILDANGIFGTSLNIGNSGGITQYGVGWFDGGISLYGSSTFTNCLISASVSGDTLTLTPANGNAITFSKAVTLSGAWGGTTAAGKYYTVTASMNNVDVAYRSSGSVKADIVPSYNSSTHKYNISYYAYTGDIFLYNNSDETGTEAYDAGFNAVVVSDLGNWSGGQATITLSNGKTATGYMPSSASFSYVRTGNTLLVYCTAGGKEYRGSYSLT